MKERVWRARLAAQEEFAALSNDSATTRRSSHNSPPFPPPARSPLPSSLTCGLPHPPDTPTSFPWSSMRAASRKALLDCSEGRGASNPVPLKPPTAPPGHHQLQGKHQTLASPELYSLHLFLCLPSLLSIPTPPPIAPKPALSGFQDLHLNRDVT